jgi:serine/threonine protein kinase
MAQPKLVDQAIDSVADGAALDWDALDRQAGDDERELLKALRVLAGIADLHRSLHDADEPTQGVMAREPSATVNDFAPSVAERRDVWGRYELRQKVGAGSFGAVYRAWDPQLEHEVAIKILHQRDGDAQVRERLLREGRALAKIRDRNVITVYGVETHGDRIGLCMEFVRGETLEDVLVRSTTLSAREAIVIGEDVCRALVAVHGAGLVHRDIKARNVMREGTGRMVLMDFGAGRDAAQLAKMEGGAAGTPVYMAPEVLAGLPASPASDIYSVGVLLYHLVTGKYPVESRSLDELRAAHMLGRRQRLSDRRSDLPIAFLQVVDRAIAPDPKERYATAGALLEALGAMGALPAERSVVSRVLSVGQWIIGLAVLLIASGILTSWHFNRLLERSDFAQESAMTWLLLGAQACLPPALMVLIGSLFTGLLAVSRYIVISFSRTANRVDAAARGRLVQAARRLQLDRVSVLGSIVLLVSGIAFLRTWWKYFDLFDALVTPVSDASRGELALLAPDNLLHYVAFRRDLGVVLVASAAAWFLLAKLAAARREPIPWGFLAGGMAIVLLTFVVSTFPFRVLYRNKFDVVMWNSTTCYAIGERPEARLILCPDLPPPRIRVVNDKSSLIPTGVTESIFARFSRQGAIAVPK